MSEDKAQEGQARSVRDAVSAFFTEINAEFHRISWPKGKELIETTLVVLAFIVGLSVTVLVFDKVDGSDGYLWFHIRITGPITGYVRSNLITHER